MEIPLKRKYTCSKTKGRYKGGPNAAPLKTRHKRKDKHPNHRALVMVVDGLTGKATFRSVNDI